MKNKLADLNNHLFAQIERLSDEDITGDKLNEEINRSKAITSVSKQIIDNACLALDAQKFRTEFAGRTVLPEMIEDRNHA